MPAWKQRLAVFIIAGVVDWLLTIPFGIPVGDNILWFLSSGIEALVVFELMYRTRAWVRWLTLPLYIIVFAIVRLPVNGIVYGIRFGDSTLFTRWLQPSQYIGFVVQAVPVNFYILVSSSLVAIVAYLTLLGKWGQVVGEPDVVCRKCKRHMTLLRVTTFTNAIGRYAEYKCPQCERSYTHLDWYSLLALLLASIYWMGLIIRQAPAFVFIATDFNSWLGVLFSMFALAFGVLVGLEVVNRLRGSKER